MKSSYLKRILRRAEKAVFKFSMVEDGDILVVGVSGGVDSLTLVDVLVELRRRFRGSFDVVPAYITLRAGDETPSRIEPFLRDRGLHNFKVVDARVLEGLEGEKNRCYWCSRRRRKALFEVCEDVGAKKVALGHVKEDFVEAFLMNILFSGETGCFKPNQEFFGGRFRIIRPFVYVEKRLVRAYARSLGIEDASESCPYAPLSKREVIKEVLKLVSVHEKRVVKNVFSAITNINQKYLFER